MKIGDVVTLKGSNVQMCIHEIGKPACLVLHTVHEPDQVQCDFFTDRGLQRAYFHKDQLVVVPEQPKP